MTSQIGASTIAGEAPALLFQIHVHYVFYGMAEEASSHFFEFFGGVSGEELQARFRPALGFGGWVEGGDLQTFGYGMRGGLGGVDDGDLAGHESP